MATPNAPKTQADLVELLKDDNKVKLAGVDGQFYRERGDRTEKRRRRAHPFPYRCSPFPVLTADGVLRGKYMSKNKFLSAAKGGFGFVSA